LPQTRLGVGAAPGLDAVDDEDFRSILEAIREFVRTKAMPRENEIMAADAIPDDVRRGCRLGLFGYAIPQDCGGSGLNLMQDIELPMELGYTSLALPSMFATNNGIAGQVFVNHGTDEQRDEWLRRIASGGSSHHSHSQSPASAPNPRSCSSLSARRQGVSHRRYKTVHHERPLADPFITFARSRPPEAYDPETAVFLVPANAPGITPRPHDGAGAWTADVTFARSVFPIRPWSAVLSQSGISQPFPRWPAVAWVPRRGLHTKVADRP
jgi:acyl-CoA dehydrogenase